MGAWSGLASGVSLEQGRFHPRRACLAWHRLLPVSSAWADTLCSKEYLKSKIDLTVTVISCPQPFDSPTLAALEMVAYQHIIDVASPLLVIQGNWSLPSSQDILPGLKDPVAVTQSIGSSIQVQQYGGNFTLLGGRAPPSNWSTESRAILTINSTSRDVSLLDSPDLIDDTTSNCSLSWNSAKVVITKYLPSSLQVTGVGMTLDIASEV